jgi:hypothetical protein
VEAFGVRASQPGVANHGVFLHSFQAAGLAHPDAFVDVFQDRHHLFPRQMGAEEDRPFPLGKPRPAPVASQQAIRRAGSATDDQIPGRTLAVLRTLGIDAAEMTQVIHDHSSDETVRQVPTVSQPDWIGWIASLAALSEGHEGISCDRTNLLPVGGCQRARGGSSRQWRV